MATQLMPSFNVQNTTQNPWAPAQPALNTALWGAQNAFDTTYNGDLIPDMDPSVTAGQNQALGIAGQGATSRAAQTGIGGVNSILQQGGIGAPMQYGIDTMQGAVNNLNPIASGQYLTNNPYLDAIINKTNSDITNSVNSQFSQAGRYGSGAHSGALGKELSASEMNARYQNFINMMNAQLQANQQIGGLAQGVAGIGQQGIGNVFNGGAALNNYQTPLYSDASKMAEIGGQRMDYEQAQIDAANQAPWTKAGNLAQIATGIGGMGGTGSGTSIGVNPVQQQSSGLTGGQVVGGLLGAAGTAAKFAPMFSDRRLKKNIKRVGTWHNGLPVYEFDYVFGGRAVGFMADEVAMLHPEAVMSGSSGFLMVDYGKAVL